jgi:hypothetical protein
VDALDASGPRAEPIRALDPAVGDGELLAALRAESPGAVVPVGIDVNPAAVGAARARLGADAQITPGDGVAALAQLDDAPSAIVLNPPWGVDLVQGAQALRELGATVATGQFDSADVFVELALRAVAPGGVVAAIVPDSLLLPEHEPLRAVLLEDATIEHLVRLPEGAFPGIARGVMVVVARRAPAPARHRIRCVRVSRRQLRELERGDGLAVIERCTVLRSQAAFRDDPHRRIRLDRFSDSVTATASDRPTAWTRWFASSRGIELSKRGVVLECASCGVHAPLPRSVERSCEGCGELLVDQPRLRHHIVVAGGESPGDSWVPFVAGEDVQRWSLAVHRWIRTGVTGIRYKPLPAPREPQLLVRKTGIGLHSVVDRRGVATTQSVFTYRPLPGTPEAFVDAVQAILASRMLLAWHVASTGESEWRSHPYVTQREIGRLPIPDPGELDPGVLQRLATAARALTDAAATDELALRELDLRIERLVVEALGLDDEQVARRAQVLDASQPLQAIRAMRFDPDELVGSEP